MTPQAQLFLAMLRDGAVGSGPVDADGRPEGPWVFTAGRATRAQGVLVGGSPHGIWRVWDVHGQLRSESEWDRGVPCGRWVTWSADGLLERVDLKGEPKGEARATDGVFVVLSRRATPETLPV